MANVLLIGADESLAAELTAFLARRHEVRMYPNAREAIAEFRVNPAKYDLIALNMSRNRKEDWKAFEDVRGFVQCLTGTPKILCFSTAYWGPGMQLAVERKGGRLVYLA